MKLNSLGTKAVELPNYQGVKSHFSLPIEHVSPYRFQDHSQQAAASAHHVERSSHGSAPPITKVGALPSAIDPTRVFGGRQRY